MEGKMKLNHENVKYGAIEADESSLEVKVEQGETVLRTQHSIVTIFVVWNTMMGTSLLSMPWAIKQAGFVNGIVWLIVMTGIMCYTCYRVLVSGRGVVGVVVSDFMVAVKFYLGNTAERLTLICSVVIILGSSIVYWILMSNFLHQIVVFIYSHANGHHESSLFISTSSKDTFDDVICKSQNISKVDLPHSFKKVWSETCTVPLFLIVLVFPLINFKSPIFFTKFNAIGLLSLGGVLTLISVKASKWGFHLQMDPECSSSPSYTENFEWTFPALTGMAALALFLHNAIIPIFSLQHRPENNTRDLIIAYGLVCATYIFIGAVFYASYPLSKDCIADNLLENMSSTDILSFVARVGLFVQMTSVLPLMFYILRIQVFHFFFSTIWPSIKHVLLFNILVIAICVLFAIFLPTIGHIISFVGAFCGTTYAIAVPCTVYMVASHKQGTMTDAKFAFHMFLILFGFINFIVQFFVIGHTS